MKSMVFTNGVLKVPKRFVRIIRTLQNHPQNKNNMAVKKHTQDKKEIASKQAHELKYICSVWYDFNGNHLPMKVLKDVVKKIGRSRRAVYAVLKYLNYHFDPHKK